eukprot:CAMPEP_0176440192 /NCGR_PEP_ID=MMETSP0127-20121128/20418_1 /TAXON_ID=938130 /ORGANISM="Platyophrya macrostoma, Strain WH" /LENGTH=99 /DNA_ID=CAMNT_0017824657 /DNA_START=55 /DNA_END=351 /DNA_ORIENTATION=+
MVGGVGGVGLAAPRHVYSAIVKNQTEHDLTLKATYELPHHTIDHLEVLIPANGVVSLPQKIITEGTCNLTGHIVELAVTGENINIDLKGPFNVSSPVKD